MSDTKTPFDTVPGGAEGSTSVIKNLEEMGMAELRQLASRTYGLRLTRDMDKRAIIGLIRGKERKQDFALPADLIVGSNVPPPGWARIMLHKNPDPTVSNRPKFVGINGYRITIPRGHEVLVPIKVVHVLNDAKRLLLREDETKPFNDPNRWFFEVAPADPFSVIAYTDGPDPRPVLEPAHQKINRPREKFRDKFGYWPRNQDLREALRAGVLND